MRKVLLIILIALSKISYAQISLPIDSATNKVSYSEVIQVDGVSKDELFTRARTWCAKTFTSNKDALQMDDRQAGRLIANGSSIQRFQYTITSIDFWLKYSLSIAVKDGKYRYEVTNIYTRDKIQNGYNLSLDDIVIKGHTGLESTKKSGGDYKARFKGYVIQSDIYIMNLVSDLKKAMSAKSNDDF